MNNWRGLWLSAVMVAQKCWDDQPLRTSSFHHLIPNISKEVLRDLEMEMLEGLEFNAFVKPELYYQYFFELKQLFQDITGKQFTKLEAKMSNVTTTPVDLTTASATSV